MSSSQKDGDEAQINHRLNLRHSVVVIDGITIELRLNIMEEKFATSERPRNNHAEEDKTVKSQQSNK